MCQLYLNAPTHIISDFCLKGKTQCIFFLKIARIYFLQFEISRCFTRVTIFPQKMNKDKIVRKVFFHLHGSELFKFCVLSHFNKPLHKANVR